MFSNPITGRSLIFSGYPPNENEPTNPEPSLTIAIIIFCIVGPFWLINRLIEYLTKKGASFKNRIRDANEILPGDRAFD